MIIKQKFINRVDLQNNPTLVYLFGDNLARVGLGGQAAAMRGEPNAVGVATKKTPSSNPSAFFYDDEYMANVKAIYDDITPAIGHILKGGVLVIPSDGLGTGLSAMEKHCPKTLKALNGLLEYLEDLDKRINLV